MTINKVILVGHIGKDPEQRALPSGDLIVNFSLATSEKYKDKAGQWQESTEWHKVVTFGNLAKIASEYVKKGSLLYVEGKIATRSWKDANGIQKYSTEIKADVIRMLGGKAETPSVQPSKVSNAPSQSLGDMLDDVPF